MYQLNLHVAFSLSGADGTDIPLKSAKAKALLAFLALPPGKMRTREEIMALLWSDRGEAQARASLRQVLTGLRKAIGHGCDELLWFDQSAITLNPGRVLVKTSAGDQFLRSLHINDPAFDEWLRDERLRDEPGAPAEATHRSVIARIPNIPSIAVLPFRNMSQEPEKEYFSDGMTQDIVTALSKIPKIFVVAHASTDEYRQDDVELDRVGREQGVRYVLRGSVRRSGETLRITAQLVEASTDALIWAQRYDRVIEDLFELQDEITREVASALQVELTEGERARLWLSGTQNHEAWQALVQVEELLSCHRSEDMIKARRLAERALKLDETYASAWSALGWSHAEDAFNGWSKDQEQSIALALAAAEKARAIDATNPDTYSLLAFAALCRRSFDEAIAHAERAMALGPNNAFAFGVAAVVRQYCDDPQSMIPLLRKSMRLCPVYPAWYAETLGWAYLLLGRHDDAIACAQDAVGIDGDYIYSYILLAVAYAETDRTDEAAAAVENIRTIAPGYTLATFARSQPFRSVDVLQRHLDGLSAAGLPA